MTAPRRVPEVFGPSTVGALLFGTNYSAVAPTREIKYFNAQTYARGAKHSSGSAFRFFVKRFCNLNLSAASSVRFVAAR